MSDPFEGWAIVELMGHRRLAGRRSAPAPVRRYELEPPKPREDAWDDPDDI